jgi:hypothetical protein
MAIATATMDQRIIRTFVIASFALKTIHLSGGIQATADRGSSKKMLGRILCHDFVKPLAFQGS